MQYDRDMWLKPDGTFEECASHDSFAYEYLCKEMSRAEIEEEIDGFEVMYPFEVLHKRGWVRVKMYMDKVQILGGTMNLEQPMKNTIDPPMNAAQMKAAKRLCDEQGESLHNAINAQRFRE